MTAGKLYMAPTVHKNSGHLIGLQIIHLASKWSIINRLRYDIFHVWNHGDTVNNYLKKCSRQIDLMKCL